MIMKILDWIKGFIHKKDNKSTKIITETMARKTVITKVLEVNAQDGIIEFPQNRTLYADQFTDAPPVTDEERECFKPKNMKEVFVLKLEI